MDLFSVAVPDRPGIRYGNVVTAAPRPPSGLSPGMILQPDMLVLGLIFMALYILTGREHRHYPYPPRSRSDGDALARLLPFEVSTSTSDGVVPVLSQLRGELIDVVLADHLDIVGQYPGESAGRLNDWMPSGADFDRQRFVTTWSRIADYLVDAPGS
jgi:hypothetical protein